MGYSVEEEVYSACGMGGRGVGIVKKGSMYLLQETSRYPSPSSVLASSCDFLDRMSG